MNFCVNMLSAAIITAGALTAAGCGGGGSSTTNGPIGECLYIVVDSLGGVLPVQICNGSCPLSAYPPPCKDYSPLNNANAPVHIAVISTGMGGSTQLGAGGNATCDSSRCSPSTRASALGGGAFTVP